MSELQDQSKQDDVESPNESAADGADNQSPSANSDSSSITFTGVSQVGMYILLAGVVIGVLLCPLVLGRMLGEVQCIGIYDGAATEWKALQENTIIKQAEVKKRLDKMYAQFDGIDVTPDAIEAKRDEIVLEGQADIQPFADAFNQARQSHRDNWAAWIMALVIAVAVLMFVEPIIESTRRNGLVRNRLALCRYLLAAGAIVMLIANPFLLKGSSLFVVAAALVISGLVAFIPVMGRSDNDV